MPDHIFSDFQIDSESYIRDSNGFKNKCERENTTVFFLKIYLLIYIWGRALVVIEGNKNAFVWMKGNECLINGEYTLKLLYLLESNIV